VTETIIVGVLSLIGTLVGSLGGILAANKLTNYRISELEKKVEKHNNVIERVTILEQSTNTAWKRIDEIKAAVNDLKTEVYKHENQ
jgi:hypothetical protein